MVARATESRKNCSKPPKGKNGSKSKLNLERLTERFVGLSVIYFPVFRQAQPDFFRVFRECLQLRKYFAI